MISVCIASRGRAALLRQTLTILCNGMALADTRIVVAVDTDDPNSLIVPPEGFAPRFVWSIADREDSLGEKYNRAQRAVSADLYVLWADDMVMPDKGWDARLAEAAAHQCGIVLFGKIPGVFQPGIAMTQKFIDAQGFFNVPYFPFWWGETWPMEIATMAGCATHAEVRVELLQETKGASRGVREILFWAELFDRLRPARVEVARRMIQTYSPDEQALLLRILPHVEAHWLQSNSILRSPTDAERLEAHYSYDAPADERYLRLKAKAEDMLKELA